MTAERIAAVITDFRHGRVRLMEDNQNVREGAGFVAKAQVVDVTTLYDSWHADGKGWAMYEDSVLRPPLWDVSYCWVNQWGNVHVAHTGSISREDGLFEPEWQPQAEHTIDWDRVDWVSVVWLWIGGLSRTTGQPIPTAGPWGTVSLAVYEDGSPADIRWALRVDPEGDDALAVHLQTGIESAAAIVTKAITFLNMRNVDVLEPVRSRPVRRRLGRTGVHVHEIHVTPVGRWRRRLGSSEPVRLGSMPLHMVRGHVARYGPRWGRGLLFGKYEGEYWIPPHTAGRDTDGESRSDYVVEVGS